MNGKLVPNKGVLEVQTWVYLAKYGKVRVSEI